MTSPFQAPDRRVDRPSGKGMSTSAHAIESGEHLVQFYREDAFLIATLASFVEAGLARGEAVIVIVTAAHRIGLERLLARNRVDVAGAVAGDRLLMRDAAETLAQFLVAGEVDLRLFHEVALPLLERARSASLNGGVRAHGEMVELLWRAGRAEAVLRLEELWQGLVAAQKLAVLCSYQMDLLSGPERAHSFDDICARHHGAVPTERSPHLVLLEGEALAARLEQREDSLDREVALRLAAERDARLQAEIGKAEISVLFRLSEAVNRAQTLDEVYGPALEAVVTGLEVERASVLLLDPDGVMRFKAWRGLSDAYRKVVEGHSAWPADVHDPQPVLVPDVEADPSLDRYRDLFRREGIRALGFIPLTHRQRLIGKFMVYAAQPRVFTERDVQTALTIATQISQAVARQALLDSERTARVDAEAARNRASFKAEASAMLAASLDYETTLQNVAKLAVPKFADWCVVELGDAPARTKIVAIEHVDPSKIELAQGLMGMCAHDRGSSAVFRTGRAQMYAQIDEAMLAAAIRDPEVLAVMQSLGLGSAINVPMTIQGRTLGVMTFVREKRNPAFGPADLETAVMLGERAALAVESATLHRDLQRALTARDDLIGVVSHDLRNLLGVMSMNAALMSKVIPDGQSEVLDKQRRYADAIRRTSGRMERLISDLLDFGSIEADRIRVEPGPEEVSSLVLQAYEDLQPLAQSKSVRLATDLPGEPLRVRCDRQRVFQVLSNVVGNAIKFTPSGGSIVIRARQAGDQAVLAVRDTGPGIAATHLPRIFDRYYQGDSRSPGGGVGLGLFIARGIVEAHGGRIWAESKDGGGSEFFFTLPVTEPATKSVTESATKPVTDSGASATI